MSPSIEIKPFKISTTNEELADLLCRLKSTRWTSQETVPGWTQGVPLATMKEIAKYWQTEYDWRPCEAWLNSYPQYTAGIDGEDVHFLHVVSQEPEALPMLLIHGWPGSVLEFRHVIEPLVDPVAHGGSARDAFHLVIPSLPGYGWSSKPNTAGWNHRRIASAFASLMEALNYDKWVAQGGDWGADIVALMASDHPPASLIGVHMNTAFFDASKEIEGEPAYASEERALKKQNHWKAVEDGYFKQQATRPQTLAYSLADSPIGQASWIYEKLHKWTNPPDSSLHSIWTMDEVLDNIMVYWLTNSGGSSARLYWEDKGNVARPIDIPVGVSIFPNDIPSTPRSWGERYYKNIVHWADVERGGHFAAWEVPDLFVREVTTTFRHVR